MNSLYDILRNLNILETIKTHTCVYVYLYVWDDAATKQMLSHVVPKYFNVSVCLWKKN